MGQASSNTIPLCVRREIISLSCRLLFFNSSLELLSPACLYMSPYRRSPVVSLSNILLCWRKDRRKIGGGDGISPRQCLFLLSFLFNRFADWFDKQVQEHRRGIF